MKIIVNTALAFLTVLLVAACSTGGNVPDVRIPDQAAAQLMSVTDNTIVPGVRAGRVFLGMTEEQLYQKMGNPIESYPQDSGASMLYRYQDMMLYVTVATHRVNSVIVTGPSYSTANGVTIGSSELETKSKLGQPAFEILAWDCSNGKFCPGSDQTELKLCYNSGLTINTNGGSVTRMTVFSGRCDD